MQCDAGKKYSVICVESGWWSFWTWFDVNRSTFDKDVHEK